MSINSKAKRLSKNKLKKVKKNKEKSSDKEKDINSLFRGFTEGRFELERVLGKELSDNILKELINSEFEIDEDLEDNEEDLESFLVDEDDEYAIGMQNSIAFAGAVIRRGISTKLGHYFSLTRSDFQHIIDTALPVPNITCDEELYRFMVKFLLTKKLVDSKESDTILLQFFEDNLIGNKIESKTELFYMLKTLGCDSVKDKVLYNKFIEMYKNRFEFS